MSTVPTVISGCGGQFSGPAGFNAKFKEWTASIDLDTENTSGFDDGAAKSFTPTAYGLTGSASGWLTTAQPIPTLATDCTVLDQFVGAFVLTADTGKTLSFNGIMTKSSIQRAAQKAGTTNYNFVSNGNVTESWT